MNQSSTQDVGPSSGQVNPMLPTTDDTKERFISLWLVNNLGYAVSKGRAQLLGNADNHNPASFRAHKVVLREHLKYSFA